MPLQECQRDGKPGFKWGESGHCYLIAEEGSVANAKRKAMKQAVAMGGGNVLEHEIVLPIAEEVLQHGNR